MRLVAVAARKLMKTETALDNKGRKIQTISCTLAWKIAAARAKRPPYAGFLLELPNGQALSCTPDRTFRLHTQTEI